MTNRDKQPALDQAALDSLLADNSAERLDRAKRLGRIIKSNISIANTNPSKWSGSLFLGGLRCTMSSEYRLDNRRIATLDFGVPSRFSHLEKTKDWLPHTEQVRLICSAYDEDLPTEIYDCELPDETVLAKFYLKPVLGYELTRESDVTPHAASYADGSQLDPPNTETVISILGLIAEQASAEQNGPAPA